MAQFLFGLGVGMALAGLLVLLWQGRSQTKAEIILQAREYGMVFPQEMVVFADEPSENGARKGSVVSAVYGEEKEPPVQVVIPAGITVTDVARILVEEGIISQADEFIREVERLKLSKKIKAGEYLLRPHSHLNLVIEELTK